jgi:flagellar biosynthesis protein FliR
MEQLTYALYKGLQRPLIFKFFKGKYIYWALGTLVAGIITGGIISAVVSAFAGLASLLGVSLPLLFYTISKQKQGLHSKAKDTAIYMIAPKHRIRTYCRLPLF